MATQCYAMVRGKVIRLTRLDACGDPIEGATSVVVSKRISSVTIDEVTEDGNDIRERNFGGEICIDDTAHTQVIGYSAEIALCGVDPDMIGMLTGQPVVKNAAGDSVGFDATSSVDLGSFGFALEVWTNLAGQTCTTTGRRQWGYTVFPFLQGGRLGGFSFEDGAVQFTITGAQTKKGNGWGVGPYDVDATAAGAASPLNSALSDDTHFRQITVTLDPPVEACGATALPVTP